ncbi:MAG: ATPase V [Paludibacteraceae bacterium]|nr:ATPase V [Paludibacteraceae bacterium]
MITQMKKYTFLVFHRDYEPFLTQLRELGVVDITLKSAGDIENDETLQAALQHEDELRRLIKQGAPDQMLQERAAIEQRIADAKQEAEKAAVWGDFDTKRIAELQEAGYKLRFFCCSEKAYKEEWGIVVANEGGKTYFVVVDNSASQNIDKSDLLENATELPQPAKSAAQWDQEIDHLKGLLAAADARIEAWKVANLERLEQELQEARQQIDWQRVQLSTDKLADGSLCLIEGFCPIDKEPELNAMLASAEVYYEETDPTAEDATPVKLHNNRFAKLFEVFTGMYGWPTYGEFDPTPILAPFYLLFFAMCMGDAGYGLVLIIFGLLTHYKKVNIEMFEGLGPIITTLGVGTTIVGFFLGTFFGMPLLEASWYPEALKHLIISGNVMGFDAQMVLAIGIGVFHICLAMVVKALCYTKRFGFAETLSVWGWVLLIVGGLIVVSVAALLNLPAQVTKWTIISIAVVSALAIYIFNKPGRNPLLNIGAGLWDTYNMATGLLGDVLSYVRLYALGLAGGMLGGAFNSIALMVLGEHPTWQWLPFLLILLFGHVLNILMSALGAFVHPLRLTFVEYFKNSGYEGKGQLYQPFKK